MQHIHALLLGILLKLVVSQNCTNDNYGITCATPNSSYCESASLAGNIILRCIDGCVAPGNCNDNLAGVPPYGVKQAAYCWEDSSTAGDAQCTFDCVNVTALNGSVFYPVGCSFAKANTTSAPSSVSLSLASTITAAASSTTNKPSSSTTSTGGAEVGIARAGGVSVVLLGVLALFL